MQYGNPISVLMGERGSGKTMLIFELMEYLHNAGKNINAYNMSENLPEWVEQREFNKDDPYGDVPNDSQVFHEEMQLDIDSKNWQSVSNRKILRYLSISRHKNVGILYSSQLASNINIDLIRMSDLRIIKMMNIITGEVDRDTFMKKYTYFMPLTKSDGFVDVRGKFFPFSNGMPSWANAQMSKAFTNRRVVR